MDTFFPQYLLSILSEFSQYFSKPNFVYFKAYVWAMMINTGSKCMTNTAQACFFLGKHISSFERFLSENKWNLYEIRRQLVAILLREHYQFLLIHGALLAIYDTTLVAKASKQMVSVQKWHNSTENAEQLSSIVGHHWGIIGLACRHPLRMLCFPIFARLLSGNSNQQQWLATPEGLKAMDCWDVALAALTELQSYLPPFIKLRLVADAYFSKVPFIQGVRARCVHLISRLRKDAKGWDLLQPVPTGKPGRPKTKGLEWKLADLVKLPLQTVAVVLYGKTQTLQVVVRDVFLRGFPELIRVVVIQTASTPILLMSTDLKLTAQQIIELYGARFSIELTIRDLKQHFGFTDYQCYSTIAFLRFVSLSCLSFCLWLLVLIDNADPFLRDAQHSVFHAESPLSFCRLKRALKRFVINKLIFSTSANHADFEKIHDDLESLLAVA